MNFKRIKKFFKNKNKFILINIIFVSLCIIFYGTRFIYFYSIENPRIKKSETLYKLVTMKKNIVTIGDGLYKDKNEYVYKGLEVDNYVKYSGRLWRIIKTTNENIKLISSDIDTSLVWSVDTNYDNSLIRSYLNSSDNNIKSYYESLSNTNFLDKTTTCVDNYNKESITCNETVIDNVGLLSIYEYQEAGGKNSYLNIGKYFWTSNVDKNNNAWYVYKEGSLNNNSFSGKTYFVYGVRPTITIKGDTKVLSGDGTKDNPYNIDILVGDYLNDKYVGEYVNFSNYNWRIIEKDSEYVKIAMDGVILNNDSEYSTNFGNGNYMDNGSKIGYYLNNDFYNTLNKEYILKKDYNLGRYDKSYKYDFNMLTEYKDSMNVGLLHVGELFINDVDNYFLMSRTITSDKMIYEVLNDGKVYAGSISDERYLRPTLYLKGDILVEGDGSINNPYMVK